MKHEATNADKQVSKVRNCKDSIVTMFPAAFHAHPGKVHEKQVGKGIDNFGGIVGGIIFLLKSVSKANKG